MRKAIDDGKYQSGLLVQLTQGVFPHGAVYAVERELQPILGFVAQLKLGQAHGGYAEHTCDMGAVGGEVHRQYDQAIDTVRAQLHAMPQLVAAA
ncbi:MAG: hypothetical protein V4621_00545 [Pseudomonadota bacterium]